MLWRSQSENQRTQGQGSFGEETRNGAEISPRGLKLLNPPVQNFVARVISVNPAHNRHNRSREAATSVGVRDTSLKTVESLIT